MSGIETFAAATTEIVHAPWLSNMFVVAAFTSIGDEEGGAELGYLVANTGMIRSPRMVICRLPGGDIAYGAPHGLINVIEPSLFGAPKRVGTMHYELLFDEAQMRALQRLAAFIDEQWLIPDYRSEVGAFNLNRLPEMSLEEIEDVDYYRFLSGPQWSSFSKILLEAGLPYWTDWIPDLAMEIEASLDMQLEAAGLD